MWTEPGTAGAGSVPRRCCFWSCMERSTRLRKVSNMSNRNRPGNGSFEELIQALASGKATWDRLEQELSAAADLSAHQKDEIRTAAQCRRIEKLNRAPGKDEKKLQKELSAFPPLTVGARGFVDKLFREQLVEGATLEGLRARGKGVAAIDDTRDIVALYSTCDPRDGAESALARLVPMLLHATAGCFERAETSESLEARHTELASAFRGARVLALISDSIHKDRRERSRKPK
jgi:hypothetical protein